MVKRFLFFACFVFVAAQALIVDSYDISDALDYCDDDTAVFVDLDETLIHAKQMLGTDAWATYEFKKYLPVCGGDVDEALSASFPIWLEVQEVVEHDLVDDNVVEVFAGLKERGAHVFGFTARGTFLMNRTHEVISSLGIDFEAYGPFRGERVTEKFCFCRGCLFSGQGVPKGITLYDFFDGMDFWPKRVVFFDDKRKNLESVEKMCLEHGIEFVGFWYKVMEEEVKGFDPLISDVQLYIQRTLGPVLSDDEARGVLKHFERIIRDGGDFDRKIET